MLQVAERYQCPTPNIVTERMFQVSHMYVSSMLNHTIDIPRTYY